MTAKIRTLPLFSAGVMPTEETAPSAIREAQKRLGVGMMTILGPGCGAYILSVENSSEAVTIAEIIRDNVTLPGGPDEEIILYFYTRAILTMDGERMEMDSRQEIVIPPGASYSISPYPHTAWLSPRAWVQQTRFKRERAAS